ncbi:MAG: STAS domain-containing protein [Plesiomonas sp.]|uniref:STAS domain-containing protein n=1 Tax=Plesiomonas sp. TaxID=2486279 RepID=UPI003F418AAC
MKPMLYTLNNWQVMTLHGELDAMYVSEHRETFEMLAVQNHNTLIDINEVHFIDSSGIGALVFLYKRLKAKSLTLSLICDQGQPRELLKLLHIDNTIECYSTIKDFVVKTSE